jgi:hypothetical protein
MYELQERSMQQSPLEETQLSPKFQMAEKEWVPTDTSESIIRLDHTGDVEQRDERLV